MAKKKWMTRVASVGAAVLLTAGLSAPAFAETQANTVKTVSNNDGAKIEKTLTMAKDGVSVPDATFTFTFTPCANSESVTAGPAHDNVRITSGANGNITTANGSAKSGNLFTADSFDGPGIYGYIVEETQSGYANDDNHVMTYSTKNYYVKVKVENIKGKLAITGVTAQEATLNDTGTAVTELVGDKIEGTDKSNSGGIPFENTYTEYANDDGTGENPEDRGLVISKTTNGTAFKTDQEFTYKIDFMPDSANSDLTTSVTNGVKVYSDKDCTNEAPATLSYNETYYFKLKKDKEIHFKLPAGTRYTVEEINDGGATSATVKYVADGGAETNGDEKTATSSAKVTEALAGENANTVTFTNTKDSNPLTGIINEYGAAIAVVAIAGAGLVTLTIRRKRNAA